MIDIDCTLLKSLETQLKKAIVSAQFDMSSLKKILSIIILTDMIEWTEHVNPESWTELKLVQLQSKLLLCYEQHLNICRTYNTENERVYTNVNTPQTMYTWDRIWDGVSTLSSSDDLVIIPTWGGILDREF